MGVSAHGYLWLNRMGGSSDEAHVPREKLNGSTPALWLLCLNRWWGLGRHGPAAYSYTRRKLAPVCAGLADSEAGRTRSNPLRTPALPRRRKCILELNLDVIGRWPRNSRVHGMYDRSMCVRTNYTFRTQYIGWSPRGGTWLTRSAYQSLPGVWKYRQRSYRAID